MDSADDDFGELYVDANVQGIASSAGYSLTVKSSEESELDPHGEPKKFVAVANDSSPCALNRIEESSYSDSDSDDDLDIVLKDEDSKPLLPPPPPPPASSSVTNNGGYACFESSLGMLQCGYSFSYPWFRTSFEKKPWRNPGMDVSDFFNFGLNEQSWNDYCKPLGRAIEVESGTLERQPSADSRPPRDSDPDVVIQVPVTDDIEEIPRFTPMEARSRSMSSNEASRSEDSRSDNRTSLKPFDDSVEDEALDENAGSSSGEQSTPTEKCCSREVAVCEKEMVKQKKEEKFCNSDGASTSSTESESSSRGDRVRISPTSSCSVGKSEESEDYETESVRDSATDDQREASTPPRQARHTEYKVASFRSGERSDRKHSRQRRSREDSKERLCGRDGYAVHQHRTIKDESHTPEADLGNKVRSRHGSSYRDSIKSWQNGRRFISERDETEGRGFRHSNREKCHDARHREQRFGRQNNKESAWGRGFDHSNYLYKHEAHLQEHTSRSSFNVNQRNYRSSFKEEDDRYSRHHCEEKYGHERSPALACERNKERYLYERVRESYHQDIDDRYHLEYSYTHGNPRQSHENELHFRRSDDEYDIDLRRYEDRVHRGEIGVPIEPAYREMHSFTAGRRREFHVYVRNDEFPDIDRRRGYTPDWHHRDRFVSEKDAWPAPSLSLRDHCYTEGRRGDSWRDDIRDFTTEAYDGQNGRLYKPAPRDDWTQKHVNIQDRLTYEDDWVHRDRRRYPLEDEIQYSMREVARSDHPSYRDEMLFHDIRMPIHNRLSTKQRSGYFKNHAHEIDERHHRSKKQRGDRHNTFTECQNPINLAGRQGKLSTQSKRRLSNGGGTIAKSNGQKPRKLVCRGNENTVQIGDLNDKEEGEIVEETRIVKGGVEVMNNERIQESLKKMEKRRERFKETKCVNTVEEATFEPRAKADDFTNQQRPFRKRRWCGGA